MKGKFEMTLNRKEPLQIIVTYKYDLCEDEITNYKHIVKDLNGADVLDLSEAEERDIAFAMRRNSKGEPV